MTQRHRDLVILLHGLARTERIFWRMAPGLRAAGFETLAYPYPSRKHGVAAAVARFRRYLEGLKPGLSRVHCVGFSLGGLVARGALADPPPHLRLGRLVMIGPPNRGTSVLKIRSYARAARALAGPAVNDLAVGSAALATLGLPRVETGIIAGTGKFFIFNPSSMVNLIRRHPGPHDGTVELDNTQLEGAADLVAVPCNHTVMCRDPRVIAETIAFLKTGRFSDAALRPRDGATDQAPPARPR